MKNNIGLKKLEIVKIIRKISKTGLSEKEMMEFTKDYLITLLEHVLFVEYIVPDIKSEK